MLAVIFEVSLAKGKSEEYIEIATELRQHLKTIDGFISIERLMSSISGILGNPPAAKNTSVRTNIAWSPYGTLE